MKKIIKFKSAQFIVLSYIVYLLSKLRIFSKQDKLSGLQIVFIISTGRTGTEAISKYFKENFAQVLSVHEPGPDFLHLGNKVYQKEGSLTSTKIFERIYFLRYLILKIAQFKNKKYYIESNNRLFSLVPYLKIAFPKAKFIYITRNGANIVRSGVSRDFFTEDERYPKIYPKKENPYYQDWKNFSSFEKTCWWWQEKDSIVYNSIISDEQSLIIKFEDLFKNESFHYNLKKILDFINIDYKSIESYPAPTKSNGTIVYKMDPFSKWPLERKKEFNKICGKHQEELGYERI